MRPLGDPHFTMYIHNMATFQQIGNVPRRKCVICSFYTRQGGLRKQWRDGHYLAFAEKKDFDNLFILKYKIITEKAICIDDCKFDKFDLIFNTI